MPQASSAYAAGSPLPPASAPSSSGHARRRSWLLTRPRTAASLRSFDRATCGTVNVTEWAGCACAFAAERHCPGSSDSACILCQVKARTGCSDSTSSTIFTVSRSRAFSDGIAWRLCFCLLPIVFATSHSCTSGLHALHPLRMLYLEALISTCCNAKRTKCYQKKLSTRGIDGSPASDPTACALFSECLIHTTAPLSVSSEQNEGADVFVIAKTVV